MCDPILEARIDALQRSLERLKWIPDFVQKFGWKDDNTPVEQYKWTLITERLVTEVMREIGAKLKKIKEIKSNLEAAKIIDAEAQAEAVGTAWAEYRCYYEKSQEIFHECLDILGGLAFRERSFHDTTFRDQIDNNILRVAEELILTCSNSVFLTPSIIIPAPKETLAKTVGRIVRLRHCEWTLWVLPLIAHEFGHIVIEEHKEALKESFLKTFVPELMSLDPSSDEVKKKLAEDEVEEYLADAFGTYFMGPAFSCAAIHLRLSPSTSSTATSETSYDKGRAHVTLGMLDLMAKGPPKIQEFSNLAKQLRGDWNGMVERANYAKSSVVEGTKKKSEIERLDKKEKILDRLVEAILEQLVERFGFCPAYRFAREREAVARKWSDLWINQLEQGSDLTLPENITASSALRDALNAAWRARLECPQPVSADTIDKIAGKASELCHVIYTKRREAAGSGSAGASTR